MAVWLQGDLQTSAYWQEVQALADDLLRQSPLSGWTIIVRPQADDDAAGAAGTAGDAPELPAEPWSVQLDAGCRELTVAVPAAGDDPEDEPEDAASYIVLDVLDQAVVPDLGRPN
jgi:hypothetical protein